jgi:putative ABC transport system ATP-binding protein
MLLVNRFLEPVAEVTEILDETQTAVSGWRRVLDLLDTPVDIIEPDPGVALPPGPPSIVAEHVSFSYRPRPGSDEVPEPALRDVSVVIAPGTSVAVVGATGSGKTTFAKLLTRLADPTEGRILVAGVDLRDVERTSLRSSLVMVPQDAFLFDTTIAENVRFGRPSADRDAVRLAFVELGLEAVDSADGLETRWVSGAIPVRGGAKLSAAGGLRRNPGSRPSSTGERP